MSNSRGFRDDGAVVVVVGVIIAERLSTKAVPESSSLLFQGVGLRSLLLEGGSGDANALLGGSGGLKEFSLGLELCAALGVGGAQGGGLILQRLGGSEGLVTELGRGDNGRGSGGGVAGGSHGREGRARARPGRRAVATRGEGARAAREARSARGRARLETSTHAEGCGSGFRGPGLS